ncbi:hypothetical protein [Candidatus Uabimicrobium amorphum]|uniref:Uncharacterized protein n=1 Tax=Uabimicrobium amorphum TaxID=2596890 RepID=A0A5S9F1R2_UABAM|nr:hypothetical protein [Candidatus Uabimicrobium amorphum]BBM82836.1 hypothetical protein UABAM_01179 [Candidatus Uabimicrobium amorphum]
MRYILCLVFSILAISAEANSFKVYSHPQEHLDTAHVVIHKKNGYWENIPLVLNIQATNHTVPVLYQTSRYKTADSGVIVECFFRIPKGILSSDTMDKCKVEVNKRRQGSYYTHNFAKHEGGKLVVSEDKWQMATQEWRDLWARRLHNYDERNEFEELVYKRWFGGLNEKKVPVYDQDVPQVKKIATYDASVDVLAKDVAPLAQFVPKDCYYIEWHNWQSFVQCINFAKKQWDNFSWGYVPQSGEEVIQKYKEKLGLSDEDVAFFDDKVDSVVMSGWDFYFAWGTNVALFIHTSEPCRLPESSRAIALSEQVFVYISSPFPENTNSLAYAIRHLQPQDSLRHASHFKKGRNECQLRDGEQQQIFAFFSRHWYERFHQPHWGILNTRLIDLDKRLRKVFLFKTIVAREFHMQSWPTLEDLSKLSLDKDYLNWLTHDLEDVEGTTRHTSLGKMFDNPAIEDISLDKVSKDEAKKYAYYKEYTPYHVRGYPPLSLQVFRQKDNWGLRFASGPIDSSYIWLRDFFLREKVTHQHKVFSGEALRYSFAINMDRLRMYQSLPEELGKILLIKGSLFDFAFDSLAASYWQKRYPPLDYSTFTRIPFNITLPDFFIGVLKKLVGDVKVTPSDFPGINKLTVPGGRASWEEFYPLLFSHNKQERNFTFSLDPHTLLRRNGSSETTTDKIPCDIRVAVDLKQAYTLRRRLFHLYVRYQGEISAKRRDFVNSIKDFIGNGMWEKTMKEQHIFPTKNLISDRLLQEIPHAQSKSRYHYSYYSSSDVFAKIPQIIRTFQLWNFYVSFRENHFVIEDYLTFEK